MKKRVLITGCSSGIGQSLARELAGRGHHVIATARNVAALADLDVAQRLALDVTSTASVEAAVEAAVADAGGIDVLVNNAGVTIWGAAVTPPESEIQRVFETNVFGMLRMVRAVTPVMRAQGSGAIVQISSAVSRRSTAMLGHYAATKAALDCYSEALRIELASFGIKVCIVALGAVETSFGANRKEYVTPEYQALVDGVKARLARSRTSPHSSASVATRIVDAVEAGNLPLRLDATGDAFKLIAARAALSDEQWESQTLSEIFGPA